MKRVVILLIIVMFGLSNIASAAPTILTITETNIVLTNLENSITKAITNNDIEMLQVYKFFNYKLNFKLNDNSYTTLMLACEKSNVEVVKFLLSSTNTNINEKDSFGNSALLYAAMNCKTDIVELLLAKGAEINSKDSEGKTALMAAVDGLCSDTVRLLINSGIDINAKDNFGQNALTYTIKYYHYPYNSNIFFDEITNMGRVHWGEGVMERPASPPPKIMPTSIVFLLVLAGIDVNVPSKEEGRTPLIQAVFYNRQDIISLFINAGSIINYKDFQGHTAFFYATTFYTNSTTAWILYFSGGKP